MINIITIAALLSISIISISIITVDDFDKADDKWETILFLVVNLLYFTNLVGPALLFILSTITMLTFVLQVLKNQIEQNMIVTGFILALILSIVPMQNILNFIM